MIQILTLRLCSKPYLNYNMRNAEGIIAMKRAIVRHINFLFLAMVVLFCDLHGVAQTPDRQVDKPSVPPITKEEKAKIESVIKEYLLSNPEIIREVIEALQAKEENEKTELAAKNLKILRAELYSDRDSPVGGNPKGDVTIVVFFDYNCGYCRSNLPVLQDLVAKDKMIRVIYKEFPILGQQSTTAAAAALAAGRQGKYIDFHTALFRPEGASDARIKIISTQTGANYTILKKDMADPKVAAMIERNRTLADSLGIDGTPAYLVGDRLVSGVIDADKLVEIVASERAKLINANSEKTQPEETK